MHLEHQLGDASPLSQLQPLSLTYKSLHFPTDQLITLCVADCCYLCTLPSLPTFCHVPKLSVTTSEIGEEGRVLGGDR